MSDAPDLSALSAARLGRTARLVDEPDSADRGPFRRDRDRIVHAQAFRRLAHKTQVFSDVQGDHYRTRLTHTIEVAQIARSLARNMGLDSDLTEALALAHDLGHTPFGHTGEDALAACMEPFGGFEHNAQTVRVISKLEQRYAAFDGLNLTAETLDGIIKHNGPLAEEGAGAPAHPFALREFLRTHQPLLATITMADHAGLEAQIAALSDDIAYTTHDIDDGVRAGLFSLDDLSHIGLVAEVIAEVDGAYPGLPTGRRMGEFTRRLITRLIVALEGEIRTCVDRNSIATAHDVITLGAPLGVFPDAVAQDVWMAKAFLFKAMYRHDDIVVLRIEAERVLRELFEHFNAAPDQLPDGWAAPPDASADQVARQVCDFIAGMTDRYALDLHAQLFDDTPDLRYGAG
ncbi:MAG: deoxyguanosinetriphosphate triphosphohydrolase [Devosiaceae bacterium]|nr:deoxyguanosinetriphosphate triphosphohydrolase [Devosiaceae bacterium MH13]